MEATHTPGPWSEPAEYGGNGLEVIGGGKPVTSPALQRHKPRELCRRCDYPITDGDCRCPPLGACPFAPARQCDCASTGVGCPCLKDQ